MIFCGCRFADKPGNFELPKTRVALFAEPTWMLPVGTRVISRFQPTFAYRHEGWVAGMVAEAPLLARNGNRYYICV